MDPEIWIDEIEAELDALRETRAEFARTIDDLGFEEQSLWEIQERRWRRVDKQFERVSRSRPAKLPAGLVTNIETIVMKLRGTYEEMLVLGD